MTKEEAQKRVDELWQAIKENFEENQLMQYEIDELEAKFDLD